MSSACCSKACDELQPAETCAAAWTSLDYPIDIVVDGFYAEATLEASLTGTGGTQIITSIVSSSYGRYSVQIPGDLLAPNEEYTLLVKATGTSFFGVNTVLITTGPGPATNPNA